jgi:PAS domain-containing protein
MKLVCAWCGSAIERSGYERAPDSSISHGMCPTCSQVLDSQESGVRLQRHIDGIPIPILLVDAHNTTVAMNAKACEILGRTPESSAGAQFGLVFDCVHYRLPEGCGRTVHCSGCVIRKSVAATFDTGEPQVLVPATLSIDHPDQLSNARLTITTVRKDGVVLLRIENLQQ